ncbi:MAG: bifunctional precorrin-2 dehydrogenase/sirohydrochlorin ferrochelatase [Candidatus Methanomethylophilus sp.]|nr:bifunctional precorrin-2 dehydrogenase/sirohydrochlorin ferrochelatase [Methanomethylophilus sp.]
MEKILMSPLVLSPRNRRITVFGGGRVALRKCQHFEGFRIKVVADAVLPELRDIADEVILEKVDPATAGKYMEGADIVVAATSDHALNDSIRDISMGKGIMTNSAHGGGDLLIPSVLHRAGYTVTVSSEGRVPAFPPYVIRMLDGFLDESYDRMLELLMRIRPIVKERIAAQPDRARILADILDDGEIWELLRAGRDDEAFDMAMTKGGLQ